MQKEIIAERCWYTSIWIVSKGAKLTLFNYIRIQILKLVPCWAVPERESFKNAIYVHYNVWQLWYHFYLKLTKLADELNSSLCTLAYSFPYGLTFHQSIALAVKPRFTPHRSVALSTISSSCFCTLHFGWRVILGGREGDCSPLTLNCFDSSMIKFRGCDKKIKALHARARWRQ